MSRRLRLLVHLALCVAVISAFSTRVRGQSINIQEFKNGSQIYNTVVQGLCPNPLPLSGPASHCDTNFSFTTPDTRLTVYASWSFTNLQGNGGYETLSYLVVHETNEPTDTYTLGITPFESYNMGAVGPAVPLLSGLAFLTGTCGEGVAYGARSSTTT